MKKKNVNLKLNLSKKTISNLDKSGLKGGTEQSQNSLLVFCIAEEELCNPTAINCFPTRGGQTCVGLSCNDFTCAGIACPGDPC